MTKVYDIINAGPRNRFMVRNSEGEVAVAHNCGYRLGGGDLMDDGKKTGLWAYGENMGVFMTKEEAHSSVQAFRELCPEIVQTWYALENAVKRCLSTKQDVKVIRRCDDGPDYELKLALVYSSPSLPFMVRCSIFGSK
jgi:hypothetical protein